MPSRVTPSPPEGGEGRVRGWGSRRAFLATMSLGLLAPLLAEAQAGTAKAIGLTMPQSLLQRADEVIQ